MSLREEKLWFWNACGGRTVYMLAVELGTWTVLKSGFLCHIAVCRDQAPVHVDKDLSVYKINL